MSPSIFIITLHALSLYLDLASNKHLFKGFNLHGLHKPITHSFFADDILFFGRTTTIDLSFLHHTLLEFSSLSGLSINMSKSSFHLNPKRLDPEITNFILSKFNMISKGLSFSYLGAPISPTSPTATSLQYIKDKIIKKVKGWHAHNLSFPGRVTLIKAVLNTMPIHILRSFLVPDHFLHDLQSIFSSFLWLSKKDKSIHWVAWTRVTQP